MIKYFELLLDLLDIEKSIRAEYTSIADKIESQKYSYIKCYHRHSFIFEWYQKLLKKEITTEEFTQIWDIKSKVFFDTKKQDSISFLKSDPVLDSNILYILDKLSEGIVDGKENIVYC